MADFGSTVKNIWMKGMEAIGNTATNIANNTKYKVDEMNMMNRRTEILADFGSKAYALWLKGEKFPEELEEQLAELKKLDEKLNDMRAERYAGVKTEEAGEPEETEEDEAVSEAEQTIEIPSEETEEACEGPAEEAVEESACEAPTEEAEAEPEEEPAETAEEDEPEEEGVPVIKVEKPEEEAVEKDTAPLSDAINELFEKMPSREEMENKVNSALDSLSQGLQKFSKEIDEGLGSLTDKMNNDKE